VSGDDPTRDLKNRLAFESGETLPADAPLVGGPSSPAMRVGTQLGRYLLEEELGRGGMGVVYAALDPELDRKVAIKLLRTANAEGTEGRSRLQREAQALAKLAHPNVIGVFDVGTSGDDVFIAMELVRGGTLRKYQKDRPWRDIVLAYVQAGRGLAAAHAAGLVHRDFKPDNVLVGTDGRMRVTDFGLVRATAGVMPASRAAIRVPDENELTASGSRRAASALASDLTEVGSVMGTPMYMAPEQMTGGEVGAAADQFALAVSLWQALHGEPPFLSIDLDQRVNEIAGGVRREPQNRKVPARVNKALVRALSNSPRTRWPSLAAFLDELERSTRSRAPWFAAAAGVGAAAVAGVVVLGMSGRSGDSCAAAGDAGRDLWQARRAEVERAFLATGTPFAADAFAFVDQRFGGFEEAWRRAAVTACEDTSVRHTQTAAVLAQRQACLTTRRHRALAMIEGLTRADRALISDVDNLLRELPDVDECADAEVLAGKTPRPTDAAVLRRLAEVERRVAGVWSRHVGATSSKAEMAAARKEAQEAAEEAAAIAYAPALAEALIARAHVAQRADDFDSARKDLVDAAAAATRGGDRENLALAYIELLFLDAEDRGDLAGAQSWSPLAGAAVDALGKPPAKVAYLAEGRGVLHQLEGNYGEARRVLEEALAAPDVPDDAKPQLQAQLSVALTDAGDYDAAEKLFEELIPARSADMGAEHPKVLNLRANRANLYYFRGDFARCQDAHRAVLDVRERVFGRDNVSVAKSLEALAVCLNKGGKAAEALPLAKRSVEILTAVRGADHPDTLAAMNDLGGVYNHLGDHAAALALNEEILATREKTLGKDHVEVGWALVNTAIEAKRAGQVTRALAYHERALAIFEKTIGVEHATYGLALINYGEALRAGNRPVEAIAAFKTSLGVLEKAIGPEHVVIAHCWYGLGLAELARGKNAEAVRWLEMAVERRDHAGKDLDRNEQAEAHAALAKALIANGGEKKRARGLAQQAMATWRELGANFDEPRLEVERWLSTVK
jgi:eukaryotic-like serine/threonine-protein kinase